MQQNNTPIVSSFPTSITWETSNSFVPYIFCNSPYINTPLDYIPIQSTFINDLTSLRNAVKSFMPNAENFYIRTPTGDVPIQSLSNNNSRSLLLPLENNSKSKVKKSTPLRNINPKYTCCKSLDANSKTPSANILNQSKLIQSLANNNSRSVLLPLENNSKSKVKKSTPLRKIIPKSTKKSLDAKSKTPSANILNQSQLIQNSKPSSKPITENHTSENTTSSQFRRIAPKPNTTIVKNLLTNTLKNEISKELSNGVKKELLCLCKICSKVFSNKTHLHQHLRTHTSVDHHIAEPVISSQADAVSNDFNNNTESSKVKKQCHKKSNEIQSQIKIIYASKLFSHLFSDPLNDSANKK